MYVFPVGATMDFFKRSNPTGIFSSRVRKDRSVEEGVGNTTESRSPSRHRRISNIDPSLTTRERDMHQRRREPSVSRLRLPPINPDKMCLVASSSSQNPLLGYPPRKQQGNRKYSSRPEVRGETSNGRTNAGRRTLRQTEKTDLLLSSYLGPVLNSGNVHYTHIIPPIGETYTIRAKQYYSSLAEETSHSPGSNDSEFDAYDDGLQGGQWMEDFFEKMRRTFTSQDDVLRNFLCSKNSHRRCAMCYELDYYNENVGAVDYMRHKVLSDILAAYCF
ncbi:uncharacterized protein [Haliotis cracherodii]|uniref:uncharacterized protein n=1 Tax=Haliotis cracherodii TaxID=6455 RepID=UPI0039ED51ED